MTTSKRVLIIISGSVAAYKTLDLLRLLREKSYEINVVMTEGAKQFVTPLSVAALARAKVYDDLWSLKDETEMGHIRLARENDIVVIAPASADIIAKYANGFANDLASTLLLATNSPVLIVPAMNSSMWSNQAVARNVARLIADGAKFVGPDNGALACGEEGAGRMVAVEEIFSAITKILSEKN
jgi:phosphopantothenoylcysteine decarboxylase/phosphopantothenate--cysteine ligase